MSKKSKKWDTRKNAEEYEKYVQKFSMYQTTSDDLVKVAGIRPGMRVVDLAAGTGATTESIIEATDGDIEVILVDQAQHMLDIAQNKFSDFDFEYLVTAAEELESVMNKQVDAVISNSAFWQMETEKTFEAVSSVIKPGGRFVFNLPDQFFDHPDFQASPRKALPYTESDLINLAKDVGLLHKKSEIKSYEKTIKEILAFIDIPIMRDNFKTEANRQKHIEKLKDKYPEGTTKQSQWIYFVFEKVK